MSRKGLAALVSGSRAGCRSSWSPCHSRLQAIAANGTFAAFSSRTFSGDLEVPAFADRDREPAKLHVDPLTPYQKVERVQHIVGAAGVWKTVLMTQVMNDLSRAQVNFSSYGGAGQLTPDGNAVYKKIDDESDSSKGERQFGTAAHNVKTNRPLSPHLTVYAPQKSSVTSITNRITGALLSGVILGGAFFTKVGDTSLSFYPVYQLVFAVSKLPPWLYLSVANFCILALLYHIFHSLRRELQQWGLLKFKV